jgi:hypothetical protein
MLSVSTTTARIYKVTKAKMMLLKRRTEVPLVGAGKKRKAAEAMGDEEEGGDKEGDDKEGEGGDKDEENESVGEGGAE